MQLLPTVKIIDLGLVIDMLVQTTDDELCTTAQINMPKITLAVLYTIDWVLLCITLSLILPIKLFNTPVNLFFAVSSGFNVGCRVYNIHSLHASFNYFK